MNTTPSDMTEEDREVGQLEVRMWWPGMQSNGYVVEYAEGEYESWRVFGTGPTKAIERWFEQGPRNTFGDPFPAGTRLVCLEYDADGEYVRPGDEWWQAPDWTAPSDALGTPRPLVLPDLKASDRSHWAAMTALNGLLNIYVNNRLWDTGATSGADDAAALYNLLNRLGLPVP